MHKKKDSNLIDSNLIVWWSIFVWRWSFFFLSLFGSTVVESQNRAEANDDEEERKLEAMLYFEKAQDEKMKNWKRNWTILEVHL